MANPRGPEIEATRKQLGIRRSELAKMVGISYEHVYGIERGFNRASEEVLNRIATALKMDISQVMNSGAVA